MVPGVHGSFAIGEKSQFSKKYNSPADSETQRSVGSYPIPLTPRKLNQSSISPNLHQTSSSTRLGQGSVTFLSHLSSNPRPINQSRFSSNTTRESTNQQRDSVQPGNNLMSELQARLKHSSISSSGMRNEDQGIKTRTLSFSSGAKKNLEKEFGAEKHQVLTIYLFISGIQYRCNKYTREYYIAAASQDLVGSS